jgi:hypothetical protein
MSSGPEGITRRQALRNAGGMTVAVLAGGALGEAGVAVAVEPGEAAFLKDDELRTLRALVDVFIPADQDGGAVEGGCAEAIDALLGAFRVSPPRIYAGAPFSDRAGSEVNHFTRFLRLDRYETKAWRLRIEGSRGRPQLERNGPVKGWQRIYRDGLAALAAQGFADLPAPARDPVLQGGDAAVAELVAEAWPHTWQFMYGAPEYGGNRDLLGWRYAGWDGDRQPRGWTREEVEAGPVPGSSVVLGDFPLPDDELAALIAMGGSPELVHNLLARGEGDVASEVAAVLADVRRRRRGG